MGHSGLLLYKKWGSSGAPNEIHDNVNQGDNYTHNYYCHLYIWLKRCETSNTYHTGQRTEQTFPMMNISSSSNGFSLTGGLPPVPCFLFSLVIFFLLYVAEFLANLIWGLKADTAVAHFHCDVLPQLTLQLVSNLACQSALNYDFVATSSRSTVISWCV